MHATALAKKSRRCACALLGGGAREEVRESEPHRPRVARRAEASPARDAPARPAHRHRRRRRRRRCRRRAGAPRGSMPPGRPPKYDVNTTKPILSAADPARLVYEAASYRDGAAVGCVAVGAAGERDSARRAVHQPPARTSPSRSICRARLPTQLWERARLARLRPRAES